MSFDGNNDYSHAGPGAKRRGRERLTLDTTPKKIASAKKTKYQQTPLNQKAASDRLREERHVTPRGLIHRIRTLTCNTESFGQMYDELQQANFPGSKVLASSVRNQMQDCIKVMVEQGLIDADQLARHRRKYREEKKAQRRAG